MNKEYLGDAVYVEFDGNGLLLTTEDGIKVRDTIYLENEVWVALERYVERLKKEVTNGKL